MLRALKGYLYLIKSQLHLFNDYQPTHTETHHREGSLRHLISGATVAVAPTMAKVQVRGKEGDRPKHGEKVYYKTPDMNRKKKGTIAGGTHEEGYTIKPVRSGYDLNPPNVIAHRDHIWTAAEHEGEQEQTGTRDGRRVAVDLSNARAETGQQKLGLNETTVLQHPVFVKKMKGTLQTLASRNGYNPHFKEENGVLHNDDSDANDLYSEYVAAAMNAFRTATSKASPEDIDAFKSALAGEPTESTILMTMTRSGKTAAMRYVIDNSDRLREHRSYDTDMEDDMESGMRDVSAQHHHTQDDAIDRQATVAHGIAEQLDGLDDPIAAKIIQMKFGLGELAHAYKEQDIAAALNRRGIRSEAVDMWDADAVRQHMQTALIRLSKTRGAQHLKDFLKSLREAVEVPLIKSHIRQYTKQDGTVVEEHDDKRRSYNNGAQNSSWKGGPITLRCAVCGKEVVKTRNEGKKYIEDGKIYRCSPCHIKYKHSPDNPEYKSGTTVVTCVQCGTQKTEKTHRTKIFNSRPGGYRCIHCKAKTGEENPNWQGGNIQLTCQGCGIVTEMNPARAKQYDPTDHPYYCSTCEQGQRKGEQHPNWSGGNVDVTCSQCGKVKSVPKSRAEKMRTPYFCKHCNKGEVHAAWVHGQGVSKYAEGWSNTKPDILARDKHTCQICNEQQRKDSRRLHIHHIDYDKNNHSADNLVALCHTCHAKTNYNREHWKKRFRANKLIDESILRKSHVHAYVREDGTAVREYENKKIRKHVTVLNHQHTHGEEVHTGAKLQHGEELIDSLRQKGWKEREVHQVKSANGAVGGKKEDMPEHEEIKAKNRDNSALQTAERQMKKMRDAAMESDDPVAAIMNVNTSRTNTYTSAIDDYREKLLNHFGHKVDRNSTATKFEKDGHSIVISKQGDGHVVHFAGGTEDKNAVTSVKGKQERESVNMGDKKAEFKMGEGEDAENVAYTAKMTKVKSKFALVDATKLTTSHNYDGHVNTAYPQEIQPRDRARVASRMQIQEIANDIKPELYGISHLTSDGAPIVGPDGIVESGNGRTLALGLAYKTGKGDEYKNWLKGYVKHLGLNPDDVAGMDAPMLVRVRQTEVDRPEFAREANQANQLGSSPTEMAQSDAERIDDAMLAKYQPDEDGGILNEENKPFVKDFLQKLGSKESASYMDKHGDPNKKLVERIQAAVFERVYRSEALTELMTESADNDVKNIIGAMSVSAAAYSKIQKYGDLDITPELLDAIDVYRAAKRGNNSIDDQLDQAGFDADGKMTQVHPVTEELARAIHEFKGSRKKLTAFFKAMTEKAGDEVSARESDEAFGSTDMFGNSRDKKDKGAIVKESRVQAKRGDQQPEEGGLFRSFQRDAFLYILRKSRRPNGRQTNAGKAEDGERGGSRGTETRLEKAKDGEEGGHGEQGLGRAGGLWLLKSHVKSTSYINGHGALVTRRAYDNKVATHPEEWVTDKVSAIADEYLSRPRLGMKETARQFMEARPEGQCYDVATDFARWAQSNWPIFKYRVIHEELPTSTEERPDFHFKVKISRLPDGELFKPIVLDLTARQFDKNKPVVTIDALSKAHVSAYDRTSLDGSLVHVREHENAVLNKYVIPVDRTIKLVSEKRHPWGHSFYLFDGVNAHARHEVYIEHKTMEDIGDAKHVRKEIKRLYPKVQWNVQKSLSKAHVSAYDRTSMDGSLVHVREHDDARVRAYGRKVQYSKNSYDLHLVRKDRFGHLPNWHKLSDETRHHILNLEEQRAAEHKDWEDWKSENDPKAAKPDAVTLAGDKSGWKQSLLFKAARAGICLLRKSKPHDVSDEPRGEHGRWIQEVADFHERLLDHKASMLNPRQPVKLMENTPDIYLQLGAQDRPIEISYDAIEKIISSPFKRSDGHELPIGMAKNLPKALHHPLMVFAPDPEPETGKKRPAWAQNSLIVLTTIEHKDKPLIIILQMDIQTGGRTNLVHRISSTYEKPYAKVKDWIGRGLLRMMEKDKGLEWLRSNRLYMHADGTSIQSLTPDHTVLFKSQNVNYLIMRPSVRLGHHLPIFAANANLFQLGIKRDLDRTTAFLRKSVHQSSSLHDKRRINSNNHNQHLQSGIVLHEGDKPQTQNDALAKSTVSGYTTHTGKRVDAYCRYCEAESIHDYKTDHHDDGRKESYKECRNCGSKVAVTKRMTKQKQAREAKTEELNTIMNELLAGNFQKSILTAAKDMIKTGKNSVILQKGL